MVKHINSHEGVALLHLFFGSSSLYHQYNTSAYLKLSWGWTSSAKPSLVWERLPSSSSQHFNKLSLLLAKSLPLFSATLAS